jgi:hypothetical protein
LDKRKPQFIGASLIFVILAYLLGPFVILLLPFLWIFIPLFIPWPPFSSPLTRALRKSFVHKRSLHQVKAGLDVRELPEYFPVGARIENAQRLLQSEGFKLIRVSDLNAVDAASWGVSAERYEKWSRITHRHPLGAFGWDILLFLDRSGTIRGICARPYYDGA